jgi:hypothetical protein
MAVIAINCIGNQSVDFSPGNSLDRRHLHGLKKFPVIVFSGSADWVDNFLWKFMM